MRRENLVGRREKFLAFMSHFFFLILTLKFEVRRESLKKNLVRRGWKKSARHWFKRK